MAIWIHVLCRSAEPVTYGELVDVMGHMGWLDEAARFEPPLTDSNRADSAWGSFRVEYAPSKRPITVHHRLTKEEMEPAFEDIQEMLDGVEDVVRRGDIAARLEQTRQMFVFEVPDDLPQDVWEMLDAAETHLARERDGIIVAQQGVFDGDMNQLVAFDTA